MQHLNRRQFLTVSAGGVGAFLLTTSSCSPFSTAGDPNSMTLLQKALPTGDVTAAAPSNEKALIANMAQAATRYLDALNPEQRAKTSYAFSNEERWRWHWTTPRNFPRNGLPLNEMSADQKTLALTLLQASISPIGLEKALSIISLQQDLGNDPELYYVTVFGVPGGNEPWGWRWEGHHLSRQFTVVGEQVAMTPFFHGAWPTKTDANLRAMLREEDAALELVNSLIGAARTTAIFQAKTLTRHETQNAAKVTPLAPVGLAYAEMTPAQQQLVTEILQTYLHSLPEIIATPAWARITNGGLEQIRFGWAGSLEYARPQYYRLQGATFLLEFDNSRNGGAHIHSVWRDFEQDFGYHLL